MQWHVLFLFFCFGRGFSQTFFRFGENQYYFSPEENKIARSYKEAEEHCFKMHSQLVIVDNLTTFRFIGNHLKKAKQDNESEWLLINYSS